jgi:hypothetical protein
LHSLVTRKLLKMTKIGSSQTNLQNKNIQNVGVYRLFWVWKDVIPNL